MGVPGGRDSGGPQPWAGCADKGRCCGLRDLGVVPHELDDPGRPGREDPCGAARVNVSEACLSENQCVVAVSSFGSVIPTAEGSPGGVGGVATKTSGGVA